MREELEVFATRVPDFGALRGSRLLWSEELPPPRLRGGRTVSL